MDWGELVDAISEVTLAPFELQSKQRVGGGDINDAWVLQGKDESYFVKLNQASRLEMFEAEFDALMAMTEVDAIRVPQPICVGVADSQAFIVMEYIRFSRGGSAKQLGEQLAALHRVSQPLFGWYRDNTIGSTLQVNEESSDWISFFRDQRLGFQLSLLIDHGYGDPIRYLVKELMENLPVFFQDYQPQPSLLHGDLWGGNYAFDENGAPVLFDPALYFGDREADIAMTELFGGFGSEFYAAYNDAWPLDSGYETRKSLYNLYHILNHANLFGSGYLSQAENMTRRLLAEID